MQKLIWKEIPGSSSREGCSGGGEGTAPLRQDRLIKPVTPQKTTGLEPQSLNSWATLRGKLVHYPWMQRFNLERRGRAIL